MAFTSTKRGVAWRKRAGGTGGGVQPFFSETFANGQFNPYGGFTYSNNSTGGLIKTTVESFDGGYAARIRFIPGESQSQLNFDLGRYVTELAIEFDLHIPANFATPTTQNNKFFMLWRDTYSDTGTGTQQFGYEYQRTSGDPAAFARARPVYRRTSINMMTDIIGDTSNGNAMISASGPLTIGAWNTVRILCRGSSTYGASDGVYKVWFNGTLFTNLVNHPIHNVNPTPVDVLLKEGYLLGWANTGFTEQTDFHIRTLKYFDTNPGWI